MFAEDLSEFFDAAEFADAAVYTAAGHQAATVNGIFENGNVDVMGMVEDVGPRFTCAASAVPDVAQGDDITIRSVNYKVRATNPDGTGLVTLKLEQQ